MEVNAYAVITNITPTKNGHTASGLIIVIDTETGETVSASFFSGGIPYGEPIPTGKYDILEPTKEGHYRLEAQDSKYGDDKVEGTDQGLLRLHETGQGNTMGCVSVVDDETWQDVDALLEETTTSSVEVLSKSRNPFNKDKTETLEKYGTLEIVDGTKDQESSYSDDTNVPYYGDDPNDPYDCPYY